MKLTVYLSGEIHTEWRDEIAKGTAAAGLPIVYTSAVTDHASHHNHSIDWNNIKVVDKETVRFTRWIKEAIWIRQTKNFNRDEGGFKLSHVWDQSLAAPPSGHQKK